eukprot:TRINITY_DN1936_c0_g1_i1.p1 TRINITY_DN1936_c0_g1~~TRINITY_DN1936_c0_g1_i1.p1  ORF type:complete len:426 (+),score=37.64 TRINITY_DN1936_c0_g1_i1:56-1333(+)
MRETCSYFKLGVTPIETQRLPSPPVPLEKQDKEEVYFEKERAVGQLQSNWAYLPEGILNCIFGKLLDHSNNENELAAYKDFVSARGVCHDWRQVGKKQSNRIIWKDGQIHLPEQLTNLCPPKTCYSCMFCYVRRFRQDDSTGQEAHYQLFLGKNYLFGDQKFLLSAVKTRTVGKLEFLIYMDRSCGQDGSTPIARVVWNQLKLKYYIIMERASTGSVKCSKNKQQLLGSTKWSLGVNNLLNTVFLRPRIQTASFLNVISSHTASHKGKVREVPQPHEERLGYPSSLPNPPQILEQFGSEFFGQGWGQDQGQMEGVDDLQDFEVEGSEEHEVWQQNGLVSTGKIKLVRRMPYWNKYSRCWEQEMWGRAKMSSQKNVQFHLQGDDDSRIALQFGKAEPTIYILDFNPCMLTAIQAFAIGLVQFSKSK